MDFGEVLTKAWKIIWKYKILWLFGIFASCASGGGGGGGSSINSSGNYPSGAYNPQIEPWVIILIIAAVIMLVLLLTVIIIAVSTFGRVGLIQGTRMADADEDAQLTFGSIFNSIKPFFWRILGLNLLVGVGYIMIAIALAFVILAMFMTICLIPLACVLIPILAIAVWVLTSFVEMANVAVIHEDLGIIEGLQRGWAVFRNNLGEMILMGLVLVLGGMMINMVLAMPLILAMIPLMMGVFAAILGDTGALAAGGVIASALCCVAYFPVLLVAGGILRAYIGSAWTLTYLRLMQGPAGEEPVALLPDEPRLKAEGPKDTDEAEAIKGTAVAEEIKDTEETEEAAGVDETVVGAKPQDDDLLPEDF